MEHKFEPFQKVLVRQTEECHWQAGLYSNYSIGTVGMHRCVGGICWSQCIPYDGNEHLLGTTNNPEPEHEYKWGDKVEIYRDGMWQRALYLDANKDGTHAAIFKLILVLKVKHNFIRPMKEDEDGQE